MAKYNCGICGKTFDTIQDRNKCEAACLKKEQAEKKRLEDENKQKIRESLMKKITDSIMVTHNLIRDYRDVTGEEPPVTYCIECSADYLNEPLTVKELADELLSQEDKDRANDDDDDDVDILHKFFDWLISFGE